MTEYRDWQISLPFTVPSGDVEGKLTEALFDAALELAPAEAVGMTARADTAEGKVWITFALPETSAELANQIAEDMRHRVREAVLSDDEACISAL